MRETREEEESIIMLAGNKNPNDLCSLTKAVLHSANKNKRNHSTSFLYQVSEFNLNHSILSS